MLSSENGLLCFSLKHYLEHISILIRHTNKISSINLYRLFKLYKKSFTSLLYTSRGHGCGIYSVLIFVDNKALKRAHSRLRNCFSNTVYRYFKSMFLFSTSSRHINLKIKIPFHIIHNIEHLGLVIKF